MHLKSLFTVVIVTCCLLSASSQNNTPPPPEQPLSFSLNDAVAYALKNNYTLQNSRLDTKKQEYAIKEIRSAGLPQLNGSLQFQDFEKLPVSLIPNFFQNKPNEYLPVKFGVRFQTTAAVQLRQLIFDGGYIIGLKASNEFLSLYHNLEKKTAIDVENSTTKAYLLALNMDENMGLLDENIAKLQNLLNEMQAMNKQGFIEELEIDRINLTLSNLNTQRTNIVQQRELAYNLLKFNMGMDLKQPLVLTDKLQQLYAQSANSGLDEMVNPGNRIEYQLLNQQQKLNQLDEKRWKFGYLPNLAAFANYQQNAQRNTFTFFNTGAGYPWFPTFVVGAQLNVPIFDGFYKQSKIQQSRLEQQKVQNSINYLQQGINLEYQQAKTKLITSRNQLDQQKKNLELAQKIYNTTLIKFKEGVGSAFELNSAENDLKTAQINYFSAMYDVLVAQTDLKKALGK